jgi:GT2 family glycosyltransferase
MSDQKDMPLVSVVVLNLNGRKWLKPCLDSLLSQDHEYARIYLVDNASTDGSPELVRKEYPSVSLIQNQRNLGSAEGYNIGVRRALEEGADYLALLNDDTKVEPRWLVPLLAAAKADPAIGVLSPMHWNYEGNEIDPFFQELLREQTSYYEDLEKSRPAELYDTDRAIGAAMLISRRACLRVGLFDPLYFIHHEETDFCRRARYHGFRVVVVTTSHICHYNRRAHYPSHQETPFINVRNIPLFNWKNPEWSIWKKFKAYLGFAMNYPRITDWPLDVRHTLCILYIQGWILLRIPLILWRTRKERHGSCSLD